MSLSGLWIPVRDNPREQVFEDDSVHHPLLLEGQTYHI